MKIKAIAPWFGGKRTLAPEIVEQLGPHTQYFEPFCGSMAVLFAKPDSRSETVNDLHGGLITLARVVADQAAGVRLFERLQQTLVCESLVSDARLFLEDWSDNSETVGPDVDDYMEELAYWYFLNSWMGRNGTAGTSRLDYQIAVRWTAGGGSPSIRWRSAVDSLPAWHQRLQNVVILQRDAFAIIPKFEDAEHTAVYVDPPYLPETRTGLRGDARSSSYLFDFEADGGLYGDDHDRLAELLRAIEKARVVVSYYDHPRLESLYPGWTKIDCSRQKNLHAQNGRGARKATAAEVLLVNGPAVNK